MLLDDWLASREVWELRLHLCELSDRKLHLLTAAFLRRVWDDVSSDHTRIAVAATEKFTAGLVTREELARLRSADLLETGELLWAETPFGSYDEDLMRQEYEWCEAPDEYEQFLARKGYILDGVRLDVNRPEWVAARAAACAREIVAWRSTPETRAESEQTERWAQFVLVCEIAGSGWIDARWPRWRTSDVLALARGIHRDQAYDRMPILADALQDAGCDDETVLAHCREGTGHVRGCWVVDLAMGIG